MPRTVAFNMAMMLASASVLLLCFLPPLPALAVACCVGMVVVDLAGHLMTVRPYCPSLLAQSGTVVLRCHCILSCCVRHNVQGWEVNLNLVSLLDLIMVHSRQQHAAATLCFIVDTTAAMKHTISQAAGRFCAGGRLRHWGFAQEAQHVLG